MSRVATVLNPERDEAENIDAAEELLVGLTLADWMRCQAAQRQAKEEIAKAKIPLLLAERDRLLAVLGRAK